MGNYTTQGWTLPTMRDTVSSTHFI